MIGGERGLCYGIEVQVRPQARELARAILGARRVLALTGAGVSTESGIPDFRGDSGIWRGADPEKVASIDGFRSDPMGFYSFWADKFARLFDADPSVTHHFLSQLEARGRLHSVITQNIDGLHQKAGSKAVYEVHGTFQTASCERCGATRPIGAVLSEVRRNQLPRCPSCGGMLKPDVVLFGEMLPPAFEDAAKQLQDCDLLLVLGSSLEVHPVAGYVPLAYRAGAQIAILNRDPGPYDAMAHHVLHGELGELIPELSFAIFDPS